MLAPWASHPERSRGRRVAQPPSPPRNEHQRDRDRIVHSTAFRRLVYKTQVFINHEGDLFRTRMTHSLEVAQLARSIARALSLNEDLVEAIALAHDLGHTPFGHAGQDALQACMQAHGGFEHNLQSLRVVDALERRYPAFDGLNLTYETREGILKHCSRRRAQRLAQAEPDGPAARFLTGRQPGLEAQLANLADEIAYNAHDIDDGVRSGLLSLQQLDDVPQFAREAHAVRAEFPGLSPRRTLAESLRRMLARMVGDVIDTSAQALREAAPADEHAVREHPPLIAFSAAARRELDETRHFLFHQLYRHPQVTGKTALGRQVVSDLFAAYQGGALSLPAEYAGAEDAARAVADYIAGMTDRFALREHLRLTGRALFEGP